MFIVKYYLLGAAICLFLTYLIPFPILQALLLWCFLSLTLVSIAYIFDTPSIFRKQQDGKIATWIRWAFIPFLLGVRAYNAWARRNDKAPPIQQVDDKLYLSIRLLPENLAELQDNNINCIVDVTAEFAGLESAMTDKTFHYLTIPTLDHKVPSLHKLLHALNWIDTQLMQSQSVVVHCALGRGRSVFVVAAYLLSKDNSLTVDEVLAKLNKVRCTAQLNRAQIRVLNAIKNKAQLQLEQPAWLIVNPVSGGGKWPVHKQHLLRELTRKFRLRIHETTPDKHAADIVKQAKESDVKQIIVGGGDGTVTEVAHELIDNETTLGIVPLGTANALCHVLYGISSKISPIEAACRSIITGKVKKIDSAQCNNQTILLLLGIGLEQEMIKHAHRKEKDSQGQFAYLTGFFNAAISDTTQTLDVSIDHNPTFSIDAKSLVVANVAPFSTILAHGGTYPEPDDGKLHISYLDKADRLSDRLLALSDITLSSIGVKERSSMFSYKTAKHIEISAEHPFDYVIDGELFSSSKLVITIKSQSLNIFVPQRE